MDGNGIFESLETATRTNKGRTLSLEEVELDGSFLILHIILEAYMSVRFRPYILGLTCWI